MLVKISEGQAVTFVYVDGTQGWVNSSRFNTH